MNHYQEIHILKQEIKRLRLTITTINASNNQEIQRLKREIVNPTCDINNTDADWTDAMRVACQLYDVTPDQIISQNRKRHIVEARQLFCYLCRRELKLTFAGIGRIIHRDHSSIMHGVAAYQNLIDYDKHTRTTWSKSISLLGDYSLQRITIKHPHLEDRRGDVES